MAIYVPLGPLPFQFQDSVTSVNMVNGTLEFYLAGTSTPTNLFSDNVGTSIGTTITLNSGGMPESGGNVITLWRDDSIALKLVLKDAAGATVATSDNIPAASGIRSAPFYAKTTAETSSGVTPTDYGYPEGDIRRYGGAGDDGSTNNATPLDTAIDVASAGGASVVVPKASGYYGFSTNVTVASLSSSIDIVGDGNPELRYTGSNATHFFEITDTNGYDVGIHGLVFNANQSASEVVRIDNPSASMADANIGKIIARKSSFLNGYMYSGATRNAAGFSAYGGFSEIVVEDCLARNMDRATGAGTPGSLGSAGIVASFDNVNAYPKKLTVNRCSVESITNNETTGQADDVDCDGVIYSVPSATTNSNFHVPATVSVRDTRFVNCKGRDVKSQANGYSIITGNTVVRDLEEAINNAVDFDLQRGGGVVRDNVLYINETSANGTTIGSSHAIVGWSPDNDATADSGADGGLSVKDNVVYLSISTGTDTLPYFVLVSNGDTSETLTGFSVKDNRVIGGRIDKWVRYASAANVASTHICVQDNEGDTITSCIQFTGTADDDTKLSISGNRNYGTSTTPVLVELSNNSEPLITGFGGNDGYTVNYLSASTASAVGQASRPGAIGGDTVDGHFLVPAQTVTLADDASHAFTAVGTYGIGLITNNFGDTTQVLFVHDGSDCLEIYQAGATSPEASFGTAQTNPDVDGDLNVWIDSSAQINIRNRLGSQRVFHFYHFGGN